MEASHDASDDCCCRGCRSDSGRNLLAAFTTPFDRSIDRSDAAVARTPHRGRCKYAPRTGNRGSIAGLSNGDETLKTASRVLGINFVETGAVITASPGRESSSNRGFERHCDLQSGANVLISLGLKIRNLQLSL